jgi:hypothetical protein
MFLIKLLLVMMTIIAVTVSVLGPQTAYGAPNNSCQSHGVYTDYRWSSDENRYKPVLWIWNNGVPMDKMDLRIFYYYNGNWGGYWSTVADNDWGVRHVHKAISGGWVGYDIAGRFTIGNLQWNDDWRWKAYTC